ncbi:MAG: hypothetical protein AAF871_02935 [Pseudomonadota bacterium]
MIHDDLSTKLSKLAEPSDVFRYGFRVISTEAGQAAVDAILTEIDETVVPALLSFKGGARSIDVSVSARRLIAVHSTSNPAPAEEIAGIALTPDNDTLIQAVGEMIRAFADGNEGNENVVLSIKKMSNGFTLSKSGMSAAQLRAAWNGEPFDDGGSDIDVETPPAEEEAESAPEHDAPEAAHEGTETAEHVAPLEELSASAVGRLLAGASSVTRGAVQLRGDEIVNEIGHERALLAIRRVVTGQLEGYLGADMGDEPSLRVLIDAFGPGRSIAIVAGEGDRAVMALDSKDAGAIHGAWQRVLQEAA